jgi:predicted dehydrogenase
LPKSASPDGSGVEGGAAMNPVRWGVLGAAAIATSRFIPAMKDVAIARLAGIASRDAGRARAVADEFGIPRHFGSYEALLADGDIEAVYVPVPNHLHVEWATRALAAGKHVLCEKPLALTTAEVAALIAARDRSGRHIEEAFAYRNHAQWRRIGELLASGAIGTPRAAQGTLAKQFLDPDDIRNNPDKGGGALYDLGSYAISACSAVFGRAPLRVLAAIDRDPNWKIDRLSTAVLDYGDAHASFTVGTQSGPSAWATHQQFSILGSNGWLRCDFPYAHGRPTTCHVYVGDHTSHGAVATMTYAFDPANHYTLQVERFSRYVRGDEVPSWPIEDALRTLAIIEALFASAKGGSWVNLPA